jgi:hypothetical protein
MHDPDDIRADLAPDLGGDDALRSLAERLVRERPVPGGAFRGDLRRRLLGVGAPFSRPRRLRLLIAAYAGSGAAMMAVAALGLAGAGPFAT